MAVDQSDRVRRRSQGATPAKDASPTKRATRSGSSSARRTPATRRSTKPPAQTVNELKDAVVNTSLPEIQTRQSYAYGSTRAPQLPEQLFAKGTMSMQQVADQMTGDIDRAQKNLADNAAQAAQAAADVQPTQTNAARDDGGINRAAVTSQKERIHRQTTPASQVTEVNKQRRTAAWASSLDESHLNDIPEESDPLDTPETKRTDPSSFPSGVFDHSYAYERGLRAPRAQQRPSATRKSLERIWSGFTWYLETVMNVGDRFENGIAQWLYSLFSTAIKVFFEFPQSAPAIALFKMLYLIGFTALISTGICFLYRNNLCDANSSSSISQTLQSFCGGCNAQGGSWNLTSSDSSNLHKLTASLNSINSRINALESRLTNRIDSKHASVQGEMESLRRQQSELTGLLENLSHGSESEVASPLIPRINFFAPANGALVNPWYTSPTRSRVQSLPVRVALSILGLKRYDANGPATALLPWQDVGDCWCASSSASGHDSIRLGVEVREAIYPTELVIEHPPIGTTLWPDTAPREIELWADMSHLTPQQYRELGIESMRMDSIGVKDPISDRNDRAFARLASVEYDLSRTSQHVQRFRFDLNQFGNMQYFSQLFVLRARTNHGADYSCLYRVRLHGVPVAANERETKFTKEWMDDPAYQVDS